MASCSLRPSSSSRATREAQRRPYPWPSSGEASVKGGPVSFDRYALTGSLAGPGIAPARLAMVYVDDAERAAEALDLVPTEAGANVWLLEPFDVVVFDRLQSLPVACTPKPINTLAASPAQVAADLMTSPGRGPQEAEALLEKMKGTEHAWRQKART